MENLTIRDIDHMDQSYTVQKPITRVRNPRPVISLLSERFFKERHREREGEEEAAASRASPTDG